MIPDHLTFLTLSILGDQQPVFHFADNLWPENPANMEKLYKDYFERSSLTTDMMHIFATALDEPAEYFDAKLNHHISILRANYYPKLTKPPRAKQLRGG